MTNKLSPSIRADRVKPFLAMDMMALAGTLERDGKDIAHMEVGQPSGGPPAKVVEAVNEVLKSQNLGYTDALGILPLREKIAEHYAKTYGVTVPVERIIVTTGSSGAFVLAFTGCFDAGARIGLASPGYPAYRNILAACDLETVNIRTAAQHRWAPTPQDLAQRDETGRGIDGLLVASPANPTGTMLPPADLQDLVFAAKREKVRFISDEIYHGLTYGQPQACALQFCDEAIIINSFSKYYSMTGWRVGWMIVPENLVRPMECLAQNMFISAPAISQYAAIGAFAATDELEQRKAVYAQNREFLMQALPQIGLDDFSPVDGAFYIYTNVSKFTNDSQDFTIRMIKEAGVATTTGLDFDPFDGGHYIRLSFAGSPQTMQKAVDRLSKWLPRV